MMDRRASPPGLAWPLIERFGTKTAARVSCYLYNTMAEIDRLGDALRRLAR